MLLSIILANSEAYVRQISGCYLSFQLSCFSLELRNTFNLGKTNFLKLKLIYNPYLILTKNRIKANIKNLTE